MGSYFSTTTTNYGDDDVTDTGPVIAKSRIVEHIASGYSYEDVDNPEIRLPCACAKVPDEFCLKPEYERGN